MNAANLVTGRLRFDRYLSKVVDSQHSVNIESVYTLYYEKRNLSVGGSHTKSASVGVVGVYSFTIYIATSMS